MSHLPQTRPLTVSVVVPARNEAPNIGLVLERARRHADDLLVIDGHSEDGTADVARAAGARVILDRGHGKGAALRQAAEEARGDILVFIDADRSHDPDDIPSLLQPILDGRADIVTGSRMRGGSDELHTSLGELIRLVGSAIITLVIAKRFGIELTDSQNGFRCIRREVFLGLGLREEITTIEQEMVIQALRRGHPLVEIPTREYRRKAGVSKINVWRMGWRYVACLLRNVTQPILAPLPPELPRIQESYLRRWDEDGGPATAD